MALTKFRISHDGLPKHVLHDHEDGELLRIRITTSYGVRDLALKAGTVIQTEDPLVIAQLTHYAPPRVPKILRKAKGATHSANVMYDHDDHKDLRPFSVVDNDEIHHIEL